MKNFRGMNPASSEINQDPNGGIDILNCDLSTIGSVKMRKGWIAVDSVPSLPFFTVDGVIDLATSAGEALIIFCNAKVFRLIGNVLTDITAANSITAGFRWRGCQSHDHVFMGNGKDQPLVIGLTGNAVTYSDYSKANSSTPAIPVGVTINTPPDVRWNKTAHGLVNGNQIKLTTTGTMPAPFVAGTIYFVVGSAPNEFQLAATLGGGAITYTTAGSGTFAYTQTGVDQTPSSWASAPPLGFVLLNQLGADRMWAWNAVTVFYSALYEPWDYVAANNAGFIDIRPGDGETVSLVTGSYGFVAVMTTGNSAGRTLVYLGTGPADLTLNHVLPMGCVSPDSSVTIGDDIVFLSPYGPSNLKRFINGTQLIQNMIGFSIAPLMHDTASLDGWGDCVAYHDIVNRRAIWWLPQGDVPNQGFVYQYDVQSWSRFNGWSINCVTRTSGNQLIAGTTNGKLMILNQGGDDNGVGIDAHYTTAWFDKGEPERNMTCPFMELWVRVSGVKISITSSWDYGDLVDSHDLDYVATGSEWGLNATDQNQNVKWWGPLPSILTEVVKPSANDILVSASNGTVTDPTLAYDFLTPDDLTTWAQLNAYSTNPANQNFANLTVKTFPALPAHTYVSKTLKFNVASRNFAGVNSTAECNVDYSLDGGSTWTTAVLFTYASNVLQTYSVPLSLSQNLALVRVRAVVGVMTAIIPGMGVYDSEMECILSDVWIEGDYHSDSSSLITEGVWQNSSFAHVRTDIYGIGRSVQFTFQMNGSGSCEILAYRPDLRSKGLL
jgi:hypothetical protein